MKRLLGLLGSCSIAAAALTGCGGSDLVLPSDGGPAELTLVDGNNQIGAAGAPLTDSLEVLVKDERGVPLAGHPVTFVLETAAPGAQVTPETATSRSDGTARAHWVLGATSGTQNVVARVERGGGADPLEVRFSALVRNAGAQQLTVADGNEQTGAVGSKLAGPLTVLVTDRFGNPADGVTIDWEAHDGSVDPASSVTGPDGRATTSWTLGPAAGPQSLSASSSELTGSPVITFTATAQAGSPASLERVSGDDQSAKPGEQLGAPLVVRLLDKQGNGVPGQAVSWVVATGGGSVGSATSTTDDNGLASTTWTLGSDEGRNTLNAVVSGIGVVGFTATAGSSGGGPGAHLAFQVQPSDTEEGHTMSPDVQVAVLSGSGDPVTDREFPIKLELLDNRGRVRAEGTVTTRSGVATFTIRIDKRGKYRLRASTDGLSSVESDRFEVDED